ncbi:hypothetical protein ACFQGT_12875 [Natrialbaceae archaeon GCM10025810]|uniref:DUF7118 family protein n=1 Tax=Halovalidus salilacus TaxID=3075124 RepID=UPI00361B3577
MGETSGGADAGRPTRPDDGNDHRFEALEELEGARNRLAAAEEAIDAEGRESVEATARAYRKAIDLLDAYVDKATGTGRENYVAYRRLKSQVASLVDSLPEEANARDAFDALVDALDKRRLSESDFERARTALEPAKRYADLLEERDAAREALAGARKSATLRRRAIDDEIAERERLLGLSEADLEAPVERLRGPIEAYNDAMREAFEAYYHEASAREVLSLVDRSRWYPFVDYEQPPADLESYLFENPAGEYAIPELLEYADYTRSKLDHYVDDADELKRRVATQRTYLEGIDAEPLTIPWPPEPAGVMRRRTREYRPFVARAADEGAVTLLRELRLLTRASDAEYERLQTAADAIERLTDDERRRLADGRVDAELERLREERGRLDEALAVEDPA